MSYPYNWYTPEQEQYGLYLSRLHEQESRDLGELGWELDNLWEEDIARDLATADRD